MKHACVMHVSCTVYNMHLTTMHVSGLPCMLHSQHVRNLHSMHVYCMHVLCMSNMHMTTMHVTCRKPVHPVDMHVAYNMEHVWTVITTVWNKGWHQWLLKISFQHIREFCYVWYVFNLYKNTFDNILIFCYDHSGLNIPAVVKEMLISTQSIY